MKKNNFIMAAAAAMLMTSGVAMATNLDTGASKVLYGAENTIATTGTVIKVGADTVKTGVPQSAAVVRSYRFDLTGGATFVANPAFTVVATAGTTNPTTLTGVVVAGGAGQKFVIFDVTASAAGVVASTDVGTFTVAATGLTVKNQNNITNTMTVYANLTAAAGATAPTAGQLATASATTAGFQTGLKTSGGVASAALKVDVSSANKKFKTTTGTSLVSAIGAVTIDTAATAVQVLLNTGADTLSTIVKATSTLTVTGDFTAAQDIVNGAVKNPATYTTSNVFFDTASPFDCAASNLTPATLTATTAVFNLNTTSVPIGSVLCQTVNGVSIIPTATAYTAVYAPTAATAVAHTVAAPGQFTLNKLTKNGVTRTVLNIPSSTVAATKKAFIRISNTSGQAGVVRATLYSETGVVLLNNISLVASLAKNSTFVLGSGNATGAAGALETLGSATWTGRAVLVIDSEIPTVEVQALVTNLGTGSVQTNLSSSTK